MGMKYPVPVWVLNLKRDEERLHFMQKQLNELGVEYRVIEAIDGHSLTEKDKRGIYSKELALSYFGRELTTGEIGCALSHIRMWELMLKEQLEEVIILEDDIRIGRSLLSVLDNRDKLPQDYEHINFSTDAAQAPFGGFITDIYRASHHKEQAYLASAYCLRKKGAQKLMNLVYPFYLPIDNFVSTTDIISYGIDPKVAVLADFNSSIGKRGPHIKPKFFLRKFWEFKEMIKSTAIFFGFSSEWLIKMHLQINNAIGKLRRR
jgi:glycosyl transferase family 25